MKNKTITIISAALLAAIFTVSFLLEKGGQKRELKSPAAQKQSNSAKPEVLGASTSTPDDIRGPAGPSAQLRPHLASSIDASSVAAESFLAFDPDSNEEILKKNGSEKLPIASLTKLLTALAAYQSIDLRDEVEIVPADLIATSPKLGLKVGDKVQALDLFNTMLIGSDNDAAQTLAEFTRLQSGRDFIDLMNQTARDLGMTDSHFSNPLGFDSPDNYSTAEDMEKLVQRTQQLAAFTTLGRRVSYSFVSAAGQPYRTVTTNKLIGAHSDIEAIKTGYTPSASGSLISKITMGGHSVIIIVLDSSQRETDTLLLKNFLEKNLVWE